MSNHDVVQSHRSVEHQGSTEGLQHQKSSPCGNSLLVVFTLSFLLCDVLICIIDDSWVGLGGVLLDGAIRGVAEGHRHPVEQSLASNQLGC